MGMPYGGGIPPICIGTGPPTDKNKRGVMGWMGRVRMIVRMVVWVVVRIVVRVMVRVCNGHKANYRQK